MVSIPTTGEKALSFAGKILPPVVGTLAFFGDPLQAGGGDLNQTFTFMKDRLLNWQFPDLKWWWSTIMGLPIYRNNIVGGGVAAIGIPIAQQLLKDFGVPMPTTVNSVLSVLKRTAAGAFAGGIAGALTWLPGGMATWGGTSSGAAEMVSDWLY